MVTLYSLPTGGLFPWDLGFEDPEIFALTGVAQPIHQVPRSKARDAKRRYDIECVQRGDAVGIIAMRGVETPRIDLLF